MQQAGPGDGTANARAGDRPVQTRLRGAHPPARPRGARAAFAPLRAWTPIRVANGFEDLLRDVRCCMQDAGQRTWT